MIVLADTAERAEEIDLGRAEDSRNRAEDAIRQRGPMRDLAQAEPPLRRAALRLQLGSAERVGAVVRAWALDG